MPSLGVILSEFLDEPYLGKNGMMGLSEFEVLVILAGFVWSQYQCDRQTDRQTMPPYPGETLSKWAAEQTPSVYLCMSSNNV